MGKKRAAVIGSADEEAQKEKRAVQREQKKLREGLDVVKTDKPEVEMAESVVSVVEKVAAEETKSSKSSREAHSRSKAYKAAKSTINSDSTYPLSEALSLLRKTSLTKFDPTVELHVVLKKAPEQKLTVNLPHNTKGGKKIALVTDEFISQLESGSADLSIDYIVASPAQMGKLVKFAKLLGPKGLMPNPKTGTVSEKPEEAAKKLASDTSMALKLDKAAPVIHTTVGKLSLKDDQLSENITAILAVTPNNIKKVVLKSTMSPAIKLQA